jgi:hypothetical protein
MLTVIIIREGSNGINNSTPLDCPSSSVIGGKKECVVVDPKRDLGGYIDIAKDSNLPITGF